jgi:hypothetical protein
VNDHHDIDPDYPDGKPSAYPADDAQYEEHTITKITGSGLAMSSGFSIGLPLDSPVVPQVGNRIRLYGKGIGYAVRGMFIDGVKVYYRTEAQEVEFRDTERFGATCEEWLRRWDEGRSVWSVVMGGLGPGYEQAIQIAAAETLRRLIDIKFDLTQTDEQWEKTWKEQVQGHLDNLPKYEALGLSGMQLGAASNLAMMLYRRGPVKAFKDPVVKDRLILISKNFPQG